MHHHHVPQPQQHHHHPPHQVEGSTAAKLIGLGIGTALTGPIGAIIAAGAGSIAGAAWLIGRYLDKRDESSQALRGAFLNGLTNGQGESFLTAADATQAQALLDEFLAGLNNGVGETAQTSDAMPLWPGFEWRRAEPDGTGPSPAR